jgi:hypothetical protein
LNAQSIVDFLQSKDSAHPNISHNLMVFGDIDARKHSRKLANALGVDFEATVSKTLSIYNLV